VDRSCDYAQDDKQLFAKSIRLHCDFVRDDTATLRRMTGEKIVFGLINDLNFLVIMINVLVDKQQN
jgi:hypothetical protein